LQVHLQGNYYRMVPVGPREFSLARDWLRQFTTPLRTLDALHLAAACANGIPIFTADLGLARAAKLLGVDHHLLGPVGLA
jgi:predicted nucleic acid-binding protein